jgi:protein-S-isoprenylcysteine O-methyltransferase Ste14
LSKSVRGMLPTILTLIAVIALSGLAYRQLSTWPVPARWLGIATIALYVVWLLGEGKVMAREATQGETSHDKGTYELYALARACTLFAALGFPSRFGHQDHLPVLGAGIGILVAGVAFRWWAIHTLGRFYSHFVREQDEHKIVQSGPYRLIRHPAYTGMLVANTGFVLCFFNWVALGLLLAFFLPAVMRRIVVEERMLFEIEGYPEFAKKRWRLLPPIW